MLPLVLLALKRLRKLRCFVSNVLHLHFLESNDFIHCVAKLVKALPDFTVRFKKVINKRLYLLCLIFNVEHV